MTGPPNPLVARLRKALAFFKRDFLIATSYKAGFAMQVGSILVWVPICYFIGEAVSVESGANYEDSGGGDYFSFLLVGIGFLGFLNTSLRTFNESIRESQLMGTLEIMLLSPTSIAQLLGFSCLWIYLFQTLRFCTLLLVGALFGMDLSSCNPLSALIVLCVSVPAFASLGILSAALIVVIKRGEALNMGISAISMVGGGVLFPVAVLPGWIIPFTYAIPLRHALEAMRLALFRGYTAIELRPQLWILALFAFVLLPISLLIFRAAVRWTKATGTLAHY